jgi:hypothetical protein
LCVRENKQQNETQKFRSQIQNILLLIDIWRITSWGLFNNYLNAEINVIKSTLVKYNFEERELASKSLQEYGQDTLLGFSGPLLFVFLNSKEKVIEFRECSLNIVKSECLRIECWENSCHKSVCFLPRECSALN